MRIGHGYDVHRFGPGEAVVLCGVRIPHTHGVLAHSDGDVALHALCDALLGAIAAGDIGHHFPDTDARYRGADSRTLLRACFAMVGAAGFAPALPRGFLLEPFRAAWLDEARALAESAAGGRALVEERVAFMRYTGQGHEIAVPLPLTVLGPGDGPALRELLERHLRHKRDAVLEELRAEPCTVAPAVVAPARAAAD